MCICYCAVLAVQCCSTLIICFVDWLEYGAWGSPFSAKTNKIEKHLPEKI